MRWPIVREREGRALRVGPGTVLRTAAGDGRELRIDIAGRGGSLLLGAEDGGVDIIPPQIDGTPMDPAADKKLNFSDCFAFRDFHLVANPYVTEISTINIAPDKARLDFDIDMSLLDAEKIERETNALIARAVDTETVWITDAELDARPELVKTMSVQPPRGAGRVRLLSIPGIDLQPCGGTHVKNTVEIGAIRVLRIRSEGKRNKRVEIALAT